MILIRKPALFGAVCASMILFAGCASTALQPGKSVLDVAQAKQGVPLANLQDYQNLPAQPGEFPWAHSTLKATGQGTAPEGMPVSQAELTAVNSARVQALTNLRSQVKGLPVGSDETVASIMDRYITIRHAIDQEINHAPVAGQRPLTQGIMEVNVELPLANIAAILQRYQVTPDQELPSGEATVASNIPVFI